MNTMNFIELPEDGLQNINGGGTLAGDLLVAGGALVAISAGGPVGVVVAIFTIFMGLCDAQGW